MKQDDRYYIPDRAWHTPFVWIAAIVLSILFVAVLLVWRLALYPIDFIGWLKGKTLLAAMWLLDDEWSSNR